MTAAPTFDLTGPLPRGRVAIEASAGTGKTYTLAALACRLVIEHDVPIRELLIVTFTRAAAAELRDRVRQRLVEALVALDSGTADDPVLRALCAADDTELAQRRSRARAAVTDFDSATITTIHGFATQVLATLGSAAPGDPDATLVDDSRELTERCTADALAAAALALAGEPLPLDQTDNLTRADLRRLAGVLDEAVEHHEGSPATLLPNPATLQQLASTILGNPGITVEPSAELAQELPHTAVLRALVDVVVGAVSRHRRARGTLCYDDVLTQVRDALHSPATGERARAALQRRFRVALIDEFQDTDPVQAQIFESLFPPDGPGTLVLVGDPKQAIYAFRGADVHTYLDAAHGPQVDRYSLATNYRSDGAVIEALDGLLAGVSFGDEQIEFRSVSAAPHLAERRLRDRSGTALPALQVRLVTGARAAERPASPKLDQLGVLGVGNLRDAVAADLAANVRELLEHGTLPDPDHGSGASTRPVRPDDIAVLIRKGANATPVRRALEAHRIPVVIARPGSVTDAPAAEQLRILLHALARPSDTTRARAFALSWFGGWDVATLDRATDAELGDVHARLGTWAERLATTSVAGALALVRADTDVIARRLETVDGDRDVTDLDHLGELLHGATGGRPCAPVQLLDALDELQRRTDETERELVDRRTESDAPAVQIITMHSAKGLEFPIVFCPSLLEGSGTIDETSCIYRHPDTGRRTIDIANRSGWADGLTAAKRKALAQAEVSGESLRLAYVALTRAQHQVTFWWAKHRDAARSPLAAILFARDDHGQIDPVALSKPSISIPGDEGALAAVGWLESAAPPGIISLTELTDPTPQPDAPWVPADQSAGPDLPARAAVLGRQLDRPGSRWSFTSITRHDADAPFDPYDTAEGDAGAADEGPDQVDELDELPPRPDLGAATLDGPPLPLAEVPGSAEFGTLVHAVLEVVDFTTADLDAELDAAIADLGRWNDWPVDPIVVRAGLRAAIDTPLGSAFDGLRLRDVPRIDRLDELSFELRLAATGHASALADLGAAVVRHLPDHDPLRSWAQGLAAGQFPVRLAGHLTGSIDAVIRVPGADAARPDRYVVVDYKTNTLGPRGVPLRGSAYHPDELPHEMAHHHYPLQALLYSVALHRYLRWRLPRYDPAAHLGGVGYLFLRGMVGAATPAPGGSPHGVFTWRPPAALIAELSDLLHGLESPA